MGSQLLQERDNSLQTSGRHQKRKKELRLSEGGVPSRKKIPEGEKTEGEGPTPPDTLSSEVEKKITKEEDSLLIRIKSGGKRANSRRQNEGRQGGCLDKRGEKKKKKKNWNTHYVLSQIGQEVET